MEQAQWRLLTGVIRRVCRSFGPAPRCQYSDALILKFYYWAVKHDRPPAWALDPLHAGRLFRPRRRPSLSQLNRRIASARFTLLNERVKDELARTGQSQSICLDGKCLCVSPVSQDRDASVGHVPGGMGRGYKLHAAVAGDGKLAGFAVLPLNRHEMPVARELIEHQGPLEPGTLVFADGNYDAHVLHKEVDRAGGWLVCRPRTGGAKQRVGGGHPVTRRQMGPARRRLIDLWDSSPDEMERLYRRRDQIERVFGHLTCTPGLLGPLPAFVRGLKRVTRWVTAKINLYHARLEAKWRLNPG